MTVRDRAVSPAVVAWRIAWTIGSLVFVQTVVCAVAAAPVVAVWQALTVLTRPGSIARWALFSVAVAPSYVLFALVLMVASPMAIWLAGWRSPSDAKMRIADMEWALLGWVRYEASLQLPRMVAGTLFRGTPLWTAHLRLNGARLGKRVYVKPVARRLQPSRVR